MQLLFPQPMQEGRLLRRYKRFLADVELSDGTIITVYCPNTGAMTGCAEPGWRVWLSESESSKRKYRYTLELVATNQGLACIHSALANKVVGLALSEKWLPELAAYQDIKSEARFGLEGSRADFLLSGSAGHCFMEVKSVTLLRQNGIGAFPDAVSARGSKHLRELISVVDKGARAVLCFCVFHSGVQTVTVAEDIDPVYASTLKDAIAAGVEVLVYGCEINHQGISLAGRLEFLPCW